MFTQTITQEENHQRILNARRIPGNWQAVILLKQSQSQNHYLALDDDATLLGLITHQKPVPCGRHTTITLNGKADAAVNVLTKQGYTVVILLPESEGEAENA